MNIKKIHGNYEEIFLAIVVYSFQSYNVLYPS